jgi:hypothetical protein
MKMGMTKKGKRTLILGIIFAILIIALLVVGYFFIEGMLRDEWQEKVTEAENAVAALKRVAYVADRDIAAGEVVDASNVSLCRISSDMPDEAFVAEGSLGGRALIDIKAGTQLIKGLTTDLEFENDDREVEFKFIYSGDNIIEGDVVDVRVKFPDGSDYIVISKKRVEGKGEEGQIILYVNEEELLLMDAAAVDAFIYSADKYSSGVTDKDERYTPTKMSRIYVSKYVSPTLQEAAKAFYVPGEAVLDELASDPNIVAEAKEYLSSSVRADFEERMSKYISPESAATDDNEAKSDPVKDQWQQYYNNNNSNTSDNNDDNGDDLSQYYH